MTAAPERARAFVALPLGAELGLRIAAEIAPALAGGRYRVPRAEGLHLTLYFLGDVERERAAALARALAEAVDGLAPPRLRLAVPGAFPEERRARVLWVGVEERAHAGRLAAVRSAVLTVLAGAGVDTSTEEREPWRPHVTVARPRGRPERAPEEFVALRPGHAWDPPAVVLLESRAGPEGSRYEPLATFPFRAAD